MGMGSKLRRVRRGCRSTSSMTRRAGSFTRYQAASVFDFPPVEGFGIMPVESVAVEPPVVNSPAAGRPRRSRKVFRGFISNRTHPLTSRAVELTNALDRSALATAGAFHESDSKSRSPLECRN